MKTKMQGRTDESSMTERKRRLINIFEDTQRCYRRNAKLANAALKAMSATKLYEEDEYPDLSDHTVNREQECLVSVTKHKTFDAAMIIHKEHPDWKITVLNFASATNPGGGVKTGNSAQEESLCRCSTLYPTLTQGWLWNQYYLKNRTAQNNLHTDACIYSPGIVVFKTDDSFPVLMEEKDWVTVDVISCAAPNLRKKPATVHNPEYGITPVITDEELYRLHRKRAKHILHIAVANNTDALVLGAFGCGAFANDPAVVAKAYADVLEEYKQYFRQIEFAIYCRPSETKNYDAFKSTL